MLTLFLIIRSTVYREALAAALRADNRIMVVGSVGPAENPLTLLSEVDPDIVLFDLPPDEGLPLFRAIRNCHPRVHIVVVASPEDVAGLRWSHEGAREVVSADSSIEELRLTIIRAAREVSSKEPGPPTESGRETLRLTSREREIVFLIDQGFSNREIAVVLGIEISTVKNHVHHILEKLPARGRSEAAARVAGRRQRVS